MSNLEIHCPYCSSMVHVRPENLGNLLQCPGCPGKFRVPSDLASSVPTVPEPGHDSPDGHLSASHGSRSGHLSNVNLGNGTRPAAGPTRSGRPTSRPQARRPQYGGRQPAATVPHIPAGAGYSAYAYSNQATNQNQNMVLVVGGVVIGVILILFVAMLVVLGSGQLGRDFGATSNNVSNQQFDATTAEPAQQQAAPEPQQPAQIVEDRSIHRTDDGKVGFTWDPGVKNNIRGSAANTGEEEDTTSGGFRSSPADYGGPRPARARTPQSSATQKVGYED